MIEKLAKIQAEVKYAELVKIQNNIENNNAITSAESKDESEVDACQTYNVRSISTWESENETCRVDFGSNGSILQLHLHFFPPKTGSLQAFIFFNRKWLPQLVSSMQRNHPFIILDEIFQGMNDISNPTGFTQLASEGIKNHGCRGKWQKEDP